MKLRKQTLMNEFYEAYWWLSEHPMNNEIWENKKSGKHTISRGLYELDIHVVKVNPATRRIEDDTSLNTEVEFWLEFGSVYQMEDVDPPRWQRYHDPALDTGGPDFESAIIKLAALVKEKYGDYVPDAN